jgi:flagellar biosynthesis protein
MEHNDEKPPNVAVALHYEPGKGTAPRVVAKGRALISERIVAQAQAADVPIAQSLGQLELEQTIPRELYKAVAEVISFLIRKGRRP